MEAYEDDAFALPKQEAVRQTFEQWEDRLLSRKCWCPHHECVGRHAGRKNKENK